jgi:hypothetical protein
MLKKRLNKKRVFLYALFLILFISPCLVAQDDPTYNGGDYSFSQKGGMIPRGSIQFYLRTDDQYTSFSTLFVGVRYGMFDRFQIAVEAGAGIGVILTGLLTYTELYEATNDRFFLGLRTQTGFKWQDTYLKLGNALLDDERRGFYISTDLTAALRLGEQKRHVLYYSIYPFFDIDITGKPLEIYFSPIHLGYEFAFKNHPEWSFAIETGYFFPLNDVPDTSWVNFPNLANVGLYYHFIP